MLAELETTIERLIYKVGARSLLMHLNNFERHFDFRQDASYKIILAIILQYFEVSERDLYTKTTEINVVNSKRVMVYMLMKKTNFEKEQICDLAGIDKQTYKRYLQHIEDTIENCHINEKLSTAITEINKMFINNRPQTWKIQKK